VRGLLETWPKNWVETWEKFAFNQVFCRQIFILRHPEKFYGRLLSIISKQTCCGHFGHKSKEWGEGYRGVIIAKINI
jgi:hypothetical protein